MTKGKYKNIEKTLVRVTLATNHVTTVSFLRICHIWQTSEARMNFIFCLIQNVNLPASRETRNTTFSIRNISIYFNLVLARLIVSWILYRQFITTYMLHKTYECDIISLKKLTTFCKLDERSFSWKDLLRIIHWYNRSDVFIGKVNCLTRVALVLHHNS